MQPCGVCGAVGVDAAGFCVQCRTFRGVPGGAPVTGQPAYGHPAGQAGYGGQPTYGQPYGGQVSAPPSSGAGYPPVSGPGYGPPAAYPPAQPAPRSRSRFTIPLVALSATLVVLVAAIVLVVIVRSGSDSGGRQTASSVDECVVGTWLITGYRQEIPVDDVGIVVFEGKGGTMTFSKDGKGTTDYRGLLLKGKMHEQTVEFTVEGGNTFTFNTSAGTISFSDMKSEGTVKLKLESTGEEFTEPLENSTDPAKYNCGGDLLSQHTGEYRIDLIRKSKDA